MPLNQVGWRLDTRAGEAIKKPGELYGGIPPGFFLAVLQLLQRFGHLSVDRRQFGTHRLQLFDEFYEEPLDPWIRLAVPE